MKYVVVGSIPSHNIVIFDIDGVLVDNTDRLKKSLEEIGVSNFAELNNEVKKKFWDIFLSPKYIDLDKPNRVAVDWAWRKHREGYGIVVLTGRPGRLSEHTIAQLKGFNIPYHAVIFRPDNVFIKDHAFKENVVRDIRARIVEAHDDSEEVCRMYSRYSEKVYFWRNMKPTLFYDKNWNVRKHDSTDFILKTHGYR